MSACGNCGAEFICAMADRCSDDEAAPCWCTALPALSAQEIDALAGTKGADSPPSCLCPDCLGAIVLRSGGQE